MGPVHQHRPDDQRHTQAHRLISSPRPLIFSFTPFTLPIYLPTITSNTTTTPPTHPLSSPVRHGLQNLAIYFPCLCSPSWSPCCARYTSFAPIPNLFQYSSFNNVILAPSSLRVFARFRCRQQSKPTFPFRDTLPFGTLISGRNPWRKYAYGLSCPTNIVQCSRTLPVFVLPITMTSCKRG